MPEAAQPSTTAAHTEMEFAWKREMRMPIESRGLWEDGMGGIALSAHGDVSCPPLVLRGHREEPSLRGHYGTPAHS